MEINAILKQVFNIWRPDFSITSDQTQSRIQIALEWRGLTQPRLQGLAFVIRIDMEPPPDGRARAIKWRDSRGPDETEKSTLVTDWLEERPL